MSYWYDFSDSFQITPASPPEVITQINNLEFYWKISEDGQEIQQEEHIGGNNSDFEEELKGIVNILAGYELNVSGWSSYCGEETIGSSVGVIEICDNTAYHRSYGSHRLLKRVDKIFTEDE
jgi:hypothetical protein